MSTENKSELPDVPGAYEAHLLAGDLSGAASMTVYESSLVRSGGRLYFLGRRGADKYLGILSEESDEAAGFDGSAGDLVIGESRKRLLVGATSAENAEAMRRALPHLRPVPLGLMKSAGCGDRLGLATPGHIRAIRNSTMAPILAQQSIRENARTGRTPREVMDDALWGVVQEGWVSGFGADADHLKSTADIDSCAAAGFTFFTIDPGDHVDNEANTADVATLRAKIEALPWERLESSWDAVRNSLAGQVDLGDFKYEITDEALHRAVAKYGRVVAHTVGMYRHLEKVMSGKPFELEMSVDETETVTTLAEHIYIAHELRRLGVKWVSLAPRYVGDFEKGVDYIGDLKQFEKSFAEHLAVSHTYGPYKLSLHSGSDKFSVYPIASRVAGELVHLKTAGTSYLEALRAIGEVEPGLFRSIVGFARERYPIDRATYHVSAELEKMPELATIADDGLTGLLDDFHAREVLHVTFGSVLHHPEFRAPFFAALRNNEEVYYGMLEKHFNRHFAPFGEATGASGD